MCTVFLPPVLPHNLPHLANCVWRVPHSRQFHAALRFGAENPEKQAKRDDKDGNELTALVKEYCLKTVFFFLLDWSPLKDATCNIIINKQLILPSKFLGIELERGFIPKICLHKH